MGKRAENEMQAISLYAGGNEIPAIAAALGVSENSLRDWKKRAGTEWVDARQAARADRLVAIEDVGSRLRRSREITTQMIGDARGQGAMGVILNQTIQSMLFDLLGQLPTTGEINLDATIDQVKALALTMQRLETSAARTAKTDQEIRKKALDEVSKKVDDATQGGAAMTAERFKEIIRESYGV